MSRNHSELCYLTIREASRLIQGRQISPVELTRAFLERIEAIDRQIKSYVTLLPDTAIAEARSAEAEILRGKYRGSLHGIPMAHKDVYDTKGVRTTAQSKVLENRVPCEDATTIARLREAGSIILGKLALYEFALSGPWSSLFEPAHNPWNPDYITGGSSSGSAAAVAASLCMGALGSDTGGSVLQPSSHCGVVGLKPTYGRVSRYGLIPVSWSLDHCGPMAWTVEDVALILQVIAGYDPKDPSTSRVPVPDYSAALREDIKGLTVGVPRHYFFDADDVNPEIAAAVDKALAELQDLGANIQEVTIPCLEYAGIANLVILMSEAFAYHRENLRSQLHNYGELVRTRLLLGSMFTASDYVQAQRARNRARRELAETLTSVDVLITPTMLKPAIPFKEVDPLANFLAKTSFTSPFNLTGMPTISIPCGFNRGGLPIGMQIAGGPFDESTVLRVAYTYQQHAKWHEKRPTIPWEQPR